MKTIQFLLMICLIAIFFFSCKKDDDDNNVVKNTHRVKQIISYEDDVEFMKTIYTYEDEKLVEIMEYEITDGEAKEKEKTEITYQGDKAVKIFYSKYDDWITRTKNSYTLLNGKVLDKTNYLFDHFENRWTLMSKIIYEYSGDALTSYSTSIFDNSGNLEPYSKDEYLYDGGILDEHFSYIIDDEDIWVISDKDSFLYSNNKLIGYIEFRPDYPSENWFYNRKTKYEYSGDNIIGSSMYVWDEDDRTWFDIGFYYSYSYDENNYLIQITNPFNNKEVIEYEEGHGNASLFEYSVSYSLYGRPKIKSTKY